MVLDSKPALSRALRLGVIVPCRDEAALIERKLANLALERWPAADPPANGQAANGQAENGRAENGRAENGRAPHRVVVVDDRSVDDTLARARVSARCFDGRSDVVVSVIENVVHPGKPGAVRTGIESLETEIDLFVLTDADVVLAPGSLLALERAFAADPGLAMACGAQHFVRDLAHDGTPCSASLGPLADASEPFDRWTARVRRLESRFGLLFSVHGQLLSWRANLHIWPRTGIAADDLDLMLQVRSRESEPRRVALATGAAFLEVKTPAGPARREQALRRARAYVQLVRAGAPPRSFAALGPDAISRAQWAFYRRAPLAAPALATALPLALTLLAWLLLGSGAALACLLIIALILTSPPGWRFAKLALLIREAARREAEGSLPARWETLRGKTEREEIEPWSAVPR